MLALPGAAAVAVQHATLCGRGLAAAEHAPAASRSARTSSSPRSTTDGTSANTTDLPPKSETMQYEDDSSFTFARTMRADTEVPIDLAVLPAGDQVALIARMDSHQDALYDEGTGQKAVPQMDVVDRRCRARRSDDDRADADPRELRSHGRPPAAARCSRTGAAQPATDGGALTPPGGQYTPSSVDAVYGSR